MAYTDIDDPSTVFQTTLYTGNGGTQTITNGGNSDLQADWLWIKGRSLGEGHTHQTSTLGVTKHLHTNNNDALVTDTGIVTAFNSDGFALGNEGDVNGNSETFVAWQWKKVAGFFDIVTYTGNGANRTIAHSLGVVPKTMIVKKLNAAADWSVGYSGLAANQELELNNDGAVATDASYWNNTRPTSSVFSLGTDGDQNTDGHTYIAFLFANKTGIVKHGKYTGNNSANGPMIYLGFKPAWVMVKKSSDTNHWIIWDNKRTAIAEAGRNPINKKLYANLSHAENGASDVDFKSNGFKLLTNTGDWNEVQTYQYLAFAENPLVTSTGIPATAR